MNIKNVEYVLALASKPKDKPSILDWRPFDKDTLDEIVNKHNNEYEAGLRRIPWSTSLIEKYGQFMAVMNYDLLEVDQIGLAQFRKVKFVFANLDEIGAAALAVEQVKAAMNQANRSYNLAQISKKPPRPSALSRFTPSPVYGSQPEVMDDQNQLEKWLKLVYQVYNQAIRVVLPHPSGQGGAQEVSDSTNVPTGKSEFRSWTRLFMDYRPESFPSSEGNEPALQRSLADIASEVRDTALRKNLDEMQTRALAQKAVLQEKALSYILASVANSLDLKGNDELVLDYLRKPLEEITLNDEYIKKSATLEVMALKLAQPLTVLSSKDSKLCSQLNLSKSNLHVLLRSSPEVLEKIKGLESAKVIHTRRAGLELPFDASELLV